MGMLDYLKQGMGMLGSPGAQTAIAYLQSRRMGADPMTAMLQMQAANAANRRAQLMEEEARAEREKRRLEEEAKKEAEAKFAHTKGAITGIMQMDPAHRARLEADPAYQRNLKANMAVYGSPELAEAGGLFAPEKKAPTKLGETTGTDMRKTLTVWNPNTQKIETVDAGENITSSTNLEIGPDGTIRFTQGRGQKPLTTGTQSTLEKDIIDTTGLLDQFRRIKSTFNPLFQTMPVRAEREWLTLKSKMGVDMSPEDRAKISEFANHKANAGKVMAQIISQLYGAVLSKNEEARAQTFLPDVGTTVFDGDSPEEFEAKLRSYEEMLTNALIRKRYVSNHGIGIDAIPLEDVPYLVEERGKEIEASLRASKMLSEEEIRKETVRRLREEFGI